MAPPFDVPKGEPGLVSCIVPVFNGERYLAEALASIRRQTHRAVEIIVVDDGSTDGTSEILAAWRPELRSFRQANAGPAAATNRGLRAARGEFVTFLDADDRWHPEKLTRQLARFALRPELDLSLAHVQNAWSPDSLAEAASPLRLSRHDGHPTSGDTPMEPAFGGPVAGYAAGTLLARRSLFETVGEFDPGLGHAYFTDWLLRAQRGAAVIEVLPDVLLFRRLHQANRSYVLGLDSRAEYVRLIKRTLDERRRVAAGD